MWLLAPLARSLTNHARCYSHRSIHRPALLSYFTRVGSMLRARMQHLGSAAAYLVTLQCGLQPESTVCTHSINKSKQEEVKEKTKVFPANVSRTFRTFIEYPKISKLTTRLILDA